MLWIYKIRIPEGKSCLGGAGINRLLLVNRDGADNDPGLAIRTRRILFDLQILRGINEPEDIRRGLRGYCYPVGQCPANWLTWEGKDIPEAP